MRLRRGAAVIEFAIVAPVLTVILLAGFLFGGLIMSQNALTAAAREGCRVASLPGTASSETVVNAVKDRLSLGGVDPDLVTVAVSPTALGDLVTGAEVNVSVSAPLKQMALFWPHYLSDSANPTITAEATYHRE